MKPSSATKVLSILADTYILAMYIPGTKPRRKKDAPQKMIGGCYTNMTNQIDSH